MRMVKDEDWVIGDEGARGGGYKHSGTGRDEWESWLAYKAKGGGVR